MDGNLQERKRRKDLWDILWIRSAGVIAVILRLQEKCKESTDALWMAELVFSSDLMLICFNLFRASNPNGYSPDFSNRIENHSRRCDMYLHCSMETSNTQKKTDCWPGAGLCISMAIIHLYVVEQADRVTYYLYEKKKISSEGNGIIYAHYIHSLLWEIFFVQSQFYLKSHSYDERATCRPISNAKDFLPVGCRLL